MSPALTRNLTVAFFVLLVACIGLDLRAGCQPGWPIGFEPNTSSASFASRPTTQPCR